MTIIEGILLNNYLVGTYLNDILIGAAGNDTLYGGYGADTMIGGVGNDIYFVNDAKDQVRESPNEGTDIVYSSISYTIGANIESLYLTGYYSINGFGNELNNIIIGNSSNNVLDGRGGADTLRGGLGNDIYYIDSLDDVVIEYLYQGIDTVYSSCSFTIGNNIENLVLTELAINGNGNILNNRMAGNDENNILNGEAGNDTLYGRSGDDTLIGGAGVDVLYGGIGNDTYYIDSAQDKVIEYDNEGIDTVYADISYTIGSNVENLTLTGISSINGNGNDLNNIIIGNDSNNILDGKSCIDKLIGGKGNDTYYIDDVNDFIIEEAESGIDTVYAKCSYALSDNVDNLILQSQSGQIVTNPLGKQVLLFGDSLEWKNYLDYYQGDNAQGFQGNCGVVSCENILIQSGVFDKKLEYVAKPGTIDYQETAILNQVVLNSLCTIGENIYQNGATSAYQQEQILENQGIAAHVEFANLQRVADLIKNNHCVIAEVNSYKIWPGATYSSRVNHAITITGVAYNTTNPNIIEGFYICDSGRKLESDAARFIPYYQMQDAFYYYYSGSYTNRLGCIVTTDNPTKEEFDSINGYGNDLDNLIIGTGGLNILDGNSGNDIIIAGSGNDTLIGGAGNDVIEGGCGNDTYIFSFGDGDDIIDDTCGYYIIEFNDINKETIVFFKDDTGLMINYGDGNKISICNGTDRENIIEKVQLSDGFFLTNIDINQIVQDMSTFAAANSIALNDIESIKSNQELVNIIINSWHA